MINDKCTVFVQRTFPVGGIETLIVRICGDLLKKKSDVVVVGTCSEMTKLLPAGVDFFPVDGYVDIMRRLPSHLKNKYKNHDFVLVSMHPRSLLAVYALTYLLRFFSIQSFHLVTHSRAFFFSKRFPVLNSLLKYIFFEAPQLSTYFMNDAALKAHELEWGRNLSGYPVIRLPLNPVTPIWVPSSNAALRIVSVGRLVPFKAYNRSAPSIARKMIDLGVNFVWDIYGDGEDVENIKFEIEKFCIEGQVNLKGPVPYADFFTTIADYDVFVGMGTALLEAAQLGMPSICAIDGDGEHSYGLFYDAPSDSVGDVVADYPKTKIFDVLVYLNECTPEELTSIGLRCSQSVLNRSDDVNVFTDAILSSGRWHIRSSPKTFVLQLFAYLAFVLFDWRYKLKS